MRKKSFMALAKKFKVVFLDSYGVLRNYNGIIPGAQETINLLRAQGKIIRVLTNDASRSQMEQSIAFETRGLLGIKSEEIITSGMMAKQFLESKIFKGKVAYLGTESAAHYILEAKLNSLPVGEVDMGNIGDISAMVFLDDEGSDWNMDINTTINLLRKKNIPVIVANSDKLYPIAKNDVAVATGGIAKLVESIINKKFIHFGKPDTQMFTFAYEQLSQFGNFDRKDILMVGDTLHTDILGGNKFGVRTTLVLTGNTRAEKADQDIRATGIIPDYICESIGS